MLRKLRYFNMCSKMLEIFYQSVVAVVSSITAGSTQRLNELIRKDDSL